ncbi:MAG: hypothetical protein WCL08_05275 [Verrucomicrobiota bacterium]
MLNTNIPDTWFLIEYEKQGSIVAKVLSHSKYSLSPVSQWKLSSGVIKTEEFEDRYEFTNRSGSLYICYKNCHGHPSEMAKIYSSLAEKGGASFTNITISIRPSATLTRHIKNTSESPDCRAISMRPFAQLGKMSFKRSHS